MGCILIGLTSEDGFKEAWRFDDLQFTFIDPSILCVNYYIAMAFNTSDVMQIDLEFLLVIGRHDAAPQIHLSHWS